MYTEPGLDRNTVSDLLTQKKTVFEPEDEKRPWGYNQRGLIEKPLMRTWDCMSGSQPDVENGSMMARAPRQRLDTFESRNKSLAIHADYKIWEPTPYISFTDSPAGLQSLAASRDPRRRGAQTVTVVDTYTRLESGLPVLNAAREMEYYGVQDPYNNSYRYYTDQYLCVWEVQEREIVGHWSWKDLARNKRWYEEVILPAWKEHRKKAMVKPSRHDTSPSGLPDLSDLLKELSVTGNAPRDASDPDYHSYDNLFDGGPHCDFEGEPSWDTDGERETDRDTDDEGEPDWDTDDEVEEANTADDMLKIIEGDW